MPKVYNKRHNNVPPDAVYVGRPSNWGNMHPIGYCKICLEQHTREQAIEAYKHTILELADDAIRQIIKQELKGKDLVCWCAPKACHADILLKVANE